MVRLKDRYILFQILYPPNKDDENLINYSKSETEILMVLHQSTHFSIDKNVISNHIKKVVLDSYGEYGLGKIEMSFSIKYFSNKTSTGIIRCGRLSFEMIIAAFVLTNRILNYEVILKCVHVSGTIKKCENHSILLNKEFIHKLKKKVENSTFEPQNSDL